MIDTRRSAAAGLLALTAWGAGCNQSASNTGDSSARASTPALTQEVELVPDAESWPTPAAESAFVALYPRLARVGKGHRVLYPAGRGEVIDRRRRELPKNHPAYAGGDGLVGEDRVLLRIRLPDANGREYFVISTDGASGDPGFYLMDVLTRKEGTDTWGEVLAITRSGEMVIFQRTNTFFPKHKKVRVQDEQLVVVPQARYPLALRTIALDSLVVQRSDQDATVIARLRRGDSVEVVAATDSSARGGFAVWVRTVAGTTGVIALPNRQCPYAVLRGLCFNGD